MYSFLLLTARFYLSFSKVPLAHSKVCNARRKDSKGQKKKHSVNLIRFHLLSLSLSEHFDLELPPDWRNNIGTEVFCHVATHQASAGSSYFLQPWTLPSRRGSVMKTCQCRGIMYDTAASFSCFSFSLLSHFISLLTGTLRRRRWRVPTPIREAQIICNRVISRITSNGSVQNHHVESSF